MKPMCNARFVVAADEASGRILLNLLNRMNAQQVTLVASTEEARALCETGHAEACLVVIHNFSIEEPPARTVESPAPAKSSILLADVVTPYVARAARRSGYAKVAALTVPPQLLYRLIGGALQRARRARLPAHARSRRSTARRPVQAVAMRVGYPGAWPLSAGGHSKIKLSS